MRMTRTARGFTLIELLIVIAIIAILAAILFPVFAAAQKSALRSRCSAGQKQIVNGILLYMQDNGGRVPPGYDPSAASPYHWGNVTFGATWNERIVRYVKSKDIFVCPSVPTGLLASGSKYFKYNVPTPGGGGFPCTYGLNWRLCTGGGVSGGTTYYPHSTAASLRAAGIFGATISPETIRAPSKVILLCEAQNCATRILDKGQVDSIKGGGGVLVYEDTGNYYWLVRWLSSPYLPQGHGGGTNFAMVDGHVQFVRGIQPNTSSSTGIGTVPASSSVAAAGLRWW